MSLSQYFSKSYFYGIAINAYDEAMIPDLRTPLYDVRNVSHQLERPHNGFKSNILEGSNTTATGIKNFLEGMVNTVNQKNNRLVFYFAGHGKTLENADGSAVGYIIPKEGRADDASTWISMDELLKIFYRVECRHVLIILDCCFAGSLEWAAFNTRHLNTRPKEIYKQHFQLYAEDKAWQVITSAAFDQTALDYGWRNRQETNNSPFASALVTALEGAADLLHNGLITASGLIVYLRDVVESLALDKNIKHRQTPRLFTLKKHDKGEFLFLNPNHRLSLRDAKEATRENNPFKGLEAYGEKDKDKFYGREKVISAILNIIKERRSNILIVTGVSGSGKTSVIKAGVKPALEKEGWAFMETIRPGEYPLEMLKKLVLPGSTTKTVIYVDQLEELVTQARNKEDAETFLNQLYEQYLQHENIFLIATLRSDFQHLINKGKLGKLWKDSCYNIPWMSREELKDTIMRPAIDMAFFYEPPQLVDTIIDDVLQYPGSLPMLSVLLSEMYIKSIENNRGRLLDAEDYYNNIGGVSGALHSKLKALLGKQNENEQALKHILLRMVNIEGDIYSKKSVTAADLVFTDETLNSAIKEQIEVLRIARIIYSLNDNEAWEPVHDAVVRWRYIKQWIEETGIARMAMQKELEDDIRVYVANDKSKNYLWDRNGQLSAMVKELDKENSLLNKKEKDYLGISERIRNRKKRIEWIAALGSIAALVVVVILISILYGQANDERDRAESSLKQYQIARFKENIQNGKIYQEADETDLAAIEFKSAYDIYKLYPNDTALLAESTQSDFTGIIKKFNLDK